MKVRFETFGCRLNRAEALQREAELVAAGWELTQKRADADLIIVRGCSITQRAQHECEKTIAHIKNKYPTKRIIIEGCLAKKTAGSAAINLNQPENENIIPTRTARAYLKVQDGCNGRCAFCIVPTFRGSAVSVPFDKIIEKARAFADSGYHEIVLTGCNLSLYNSQGRNFAQAVDAIADISPDVRIRVGSIEPVKAAQELIDVMVQRPNVCRFLHLPIQSGSSKILASMRRPYSIRDVNAIIEKALGAFPLIGLGCDLITGFPGESILDFLATKQLLVKYPFSNVHVFAYSERPGTPAANMPGKLPKEIRKSRALEISKLAEQNRKRYLKRFIGRNVEFVIEDNKKMTGWSGEYFPCMLDLKTCSKIPRRKDLVNATVTSAKDGVLTATI